MLAGYQKEAMYQSRKPEIMADAAYVILTRDSKSFSGNFCIDDNVLKEVGETDFDQYSYKPGKCRNLNPTIRSNWRMFKTDLLGKKKVCLSLPRIAFKNWIWSY